jgi:hypothetical protein
LLGQYQKRISNWAKRLIDLGGRATGWRRERTGVIRGHPWDSISQSGILVGRDDESEMAVVATADDGRDGLWPSIWS